MLFYFAEKRELIRIFTIWFRRPLFRKLQDILFKFLPMCEAQKMNTALHHDQFCLRSISKHFNFLFSISHTKDSIIRSLMPVRYRTE